MLQELQPLIANFFFIPLTVLLGIYLSARLNLIQLTKIRRAWKLFIGDRDQSKHKSTSFSAVAAILGGNLGTGNIAGIAVALASGGPGSLFWMWVMALLGTVLKFTGTTLGVLYREQDSSGEYVGGPMYYLANGLGSKWLARLFCVFTIGSALTVGNMVQMNSVALPLSTLEVPKLLSGLVMAGLVAGVILGGLGRFSKVVAAIVPIMALGYIGACLIILVANYQQILPSLWLIINSAFSITNVAGGVAGYALMETIQVGFSRGLFATDVGAGLAPIIHSSVESDTDIKITALSQGLISMISPIVVMLVCTMTGLVLIVTDTWQLQGLESTNLCIHAFQRGFSHNLAGHIVTITLIFFAFTTILTWSFCADKAIEYLFGIKAIRYFQAIFVLLIPVGALAHVGFVWQIADLFLSMMLLINLTGVIWLSSKVIELVKKAQYPIRD